jgi:hypothetical protein
LAAGYLIGGIFLVIRLFLEKKAHSTGARANVYLLENVLLVGFIASMVYLLLSMGEAQ